MDNHRLTEGQFKKFALAMGQMPIDYCVFYSYKRIFYEG